MRITLLLTAALVSWAIYDVYLFRRSRSSFAVTSTEISNYEPELLRQQKKILRNRFDVIPLKHRGRKKYKPKCNYFNTKPRDVRFSNQRKIRRMFNNL